MYAPTSATEQELVFRFSDIKRSTNSHSSTTPVSSTSSSAVSSSSERQCGGHRRADHSQMWTLTSCHVHVTYTLTQQSQIGSGTGSQLKRQLYVVPANVGFTACAREQCKDRLKTTQKLEKVHRRDCPTPRPCPGFSPRLYWNRVRLLLHKSRRTWNAEVQSRTG